MKTRYLGIIILAVVLIQLGCRGKGNGQQPVVKSSVATEVQNVEESPEKKEANEEKSKLQQEDKSNTKQSDANKDKKDEKQKDATKLAKADVNAQSAVKTDKEPQTADTKTQEIVKQESVNESVKLKIDKNLKTTSQEAKPQAEEKSLTQVDKSSLTATTVAAASSKELQRVFTIKDLSYGAISVRVINIERMVKQDGYHPSYEITSFDPVNQIQCTFRVVSYDAPYVGMRLHRFSKAYLTDEGVLVLPGRISHSRSALRESADFICFADEGSKFNMLHLPVEKFVNFFSDALEITVLNRN